MNKNGFYKRFFAMYIILVLQNVLGLSVNLTDNIMLGSFNENALAGVTAVNQIQFIFFQMLNALGDGVVIIGTQYFGKRDTVSIQKVAGIALRFSLLIAAILFTITSLFPNAVLRVFTNEEAIIAEGMRYLSIIRFTYILSAITIMILATSRAVEVVRIAFYLSVGTLVINFCLNYCLIYGNFGFVSLGAKGAAIGTLTARMVECMVAVWYVLKKGKIPEFQIRNIVHIDKELLKDYIKLTIPIFVIASMWGVNTALQTSILGHMDSKAIAANSAASNLFLLVKSAVVGAAGAGGIIIGKSIGEGDMSVVKNYAKRLQIIYISIGVIFATVLFAIRVPILSLYNLSPEAGKLADTFIKILCIIFVTMSYQMPTSEGIIKGGGNAGFVVKMNLISIWGIVIPLSYIMAFVFNATPAAVVWCLNLDQIFKCIPVFVKANYGNWIRKLTR